MTRRQSISVIKCNPHRPSNSSSPKTTSLQELGPNDIAQTKRVEVSALMWSTFIREKEQASQQNFND